MSRLLLIDDDPVLRDMLAIQLVRAGHVVLEAGDGREAMKVYRADPVELVITDVVMPNRDGLELIAELRRERPDLPIIAISGETRFPLYLAIATKLGAQRVIPKPFAAEVILRAIRELLPRAAAATGLYIIMLQSEPDLPKGNGELILVVDDDADVAEISAAILAKFGYRAITCRDGADAIVLFAGRSAEIAAVITDLNLPKLGGQALAVILHRLRPEVKILAMTGLNSREPSDLPGTASFAGTIQKPFSVETFLRALDRALHAERGGIG